MCVCEWVGLLPRQLEIACIDLHQTGFIGKGSDHLQLIKFRPSRVPREGVCGGAKIFGSVLLQPARSVCVSSECFFSFQLLLEDSLSNFYAVYPLIRTDKHFNQNMSLLNGMFTNVSVVCDNALFPLL